MTTTTNNNDAGVEEGGSSSSSRSLLDQYMIAVKCIENVGGDEQQEQDQQQRKLRDAISTLQRLQHECSARKMLPSKNETSLDDVSTSTLPFLSIEHHMAIAYTKLSTTTTPWSRDASGGQGVIMVSDEDPMIWRRDNLRRSCDLWSAFLQTFSQLDQLSKSEQKELDDLMEVASSTFRNIDNDNHHDDRPASLSSSLRIHIDRDTKIDRFRQKRDIEKELERFNALMQRRRRLDVDDMDAFDGYDDMESIVRSLRISQYNLYKIMAYEEWMSIIREIPLIQDMIRRRKEQQSQQSSTAGHQRRQQHLKRPMGVPPPNGASSSVPYVTHVTRDATTGQLLMQREEIRSNTFRPGWNQPTMSLDELARREVADAMERDRRQAVAEQTRKAEPRRYEQLVKDGLEDNDELVNASAELDRKWDDWKDENPRGSGNKRGDVGDRNF